MKKLDPTYEEKELDGQLHWRVAAMPPGLWQRVPETAIDRLLCFLKQELGIRKVQHLLSLLGISAASISRARNDKLDIPNDWLVRMHDISGFSIVDLRKVAKLEPTLPKHEPLFQSSYRYSRAAKSYYGSVK